MKFQAKASADFEIVPSGNHVAICNAVVDLGVQPGRGMYPDPKHECYVRFELPTETIKYQKDGKDLEGPMSIGRTFTASMSEKANLRKFIEGWFGKKFPNDDAAADFDLKAVLGKKCLLNVTHTEKNGKTYANVTAAAPIPRGMTAEYAQHNVSLYFSLDTPDQKAFDKMPKWIREKIEARIVPQNTVTPQRASHDTQADTEVDSALDDDIPF
jgi:hypothetical protein